MKKDFSKHIPVVLGIIVILDVMLWVSIFSYRGKTGEEIYFLDVGQGDSSLVLFDDGVKLLIDGGPMNGRVEKNLEAILPAADRYIDLVMISHPQLDHFGGLLGLLNNYKIGAILTPSDEGESDAWKEFERLRKEKGIPRIFLSAGDRIIHSDAKFSILSPSSGAVKDINDISLAGILEISGTKAFFGGDIGLKKEAELAGIYDLDVDILKVSHHGSKYSSDPEFLKEASPLISVIEVGKNSYGHPTKEALSRLGNVGSEIFRTDLAGFVKVFVENGKLQVYTQKQL